MINRLIDSSNFTTNSNYRFTDQPVTAITDRLATHLAGIAQNILMRNNPDLLPVIERTIRPFDSIRNGTSIILQQMEKLNTQLDFLVSLEPIIREIVSLESNISRFINLFNQFAAIVIEAPRSELEFYRSISNPFIETIQILLRSGNHRLLTEVTQRCPALLNPRHHWVAHLGADLLEAALASPDPSTLNFVLDGFSPRSTNAASSLSTNQPQESNEQRDASFFYAHPNDPVWAIIREAQTLNERPPERFPTEDIEKFTQLLNAFAQNMGFPSGTESFRFYKAAAKPFVRTIQRLVQFGNISLLTQVLQNCPVLTDPQYPWMEHLGSGLLEAALASNQRSMLEFVLNRSTQRSTDIDEIAPLSLREPPEWDGQRDASFFYAHPNDRVFGMIREVLTFNESLGIFFSRENLEALITLINEFAENAGSPRGDRSIAVNFYRSAIRPFVHTIQLLVRSGDVDSCNEIIRRCPVLKGSRYPWSEIFRDVLVEDAIASGNPDMLTLVLRLCPTGFPRDLLHLLRVLHQNKNPNLLSVFLNHVRQPHYFAENRIFLLWSPDVTVDPAIVPLLLDLLTPSSVVVLARRLIEGWNIGSEQLSFERMDVITEIFRRIQRDNPDSESLNYFFDFLLFEDTTYSVCLAIFRGRFLDTFAQTFIERTRRLVSARDNRRLRSFMVFLRHLMIPQSHLLDLTLSLRQHVSDPIQRTEVLGILGDVFANQAVDVLFFDPHLDSAFLIRLLRSVITRWNVRSERALRRIFTRIRHNQFHLRRLASLVECLASFCTTESPPFLRLFQIEFPDIIQPIINHFSQLACSENIAYDQRLENVKKLFFFLKRLSLSPSQLESLCEQVYRFSLSQEWIGFEEERERTLGLLIEVFPEAQRHLSEIRRREEEPEVTRCASGCERIVSST